MNPFAQPQAHQQHFVGLFSARDSGSLGETVAVFFNARQPRLRFFLGDCCDACRHSPPPCGEGLGVGGIPQVIFCDSPPPGLPHKGGGVSNNDPPMRAGTNAGVFAVAPIEQVVPALFTWTRVIGNLVGVEPTRRCHFLRNFIERERGIRIGHDQFSGCVQRRVGRVGFNSQLIERDVIAREFKRFGEFRAPGVRLLTRPRVDQIK